MKTAILTEEDVKHVAKLANIQLTPKEIKKFQQQLSAVIDYIGKLKEINTDKVEPTSQVTGLKGVTESDRQDNQRALSQSKTLKNASNKSDQYFKVKAIFDNSEENI